MTRSKASNRAGTLKGVKTRIDRIAAEIHAIDGLHCLLPSPFLPAKNEDFPCRKANTLGEDEGDRRLRDNDTMEDAMVQRGTYPLFGKIPYRKQTSGQSRRTRAKTTGKIEGNALDAEAQ